MRDIRAHFLSVLCTKHDNSTRHSDVPAVVDVDMGAKAWLTNDLGTARGSEGQWDISEENVGRRNG